MSALFVGPSAVVLGRGKRAKEKRDEKQSDEGEYVAGMGGDGGVRLRWIIWGEGFRGPV